MSRCSSLPSGSPVSSGGGPGLVPERPAARDQLRIAIFNTPRSSWWECRWIFPHRGT